VSPEVFAGWFLDFSTEWLRNFKDAGVSDEEALALTILLCDKVYPSAASPVSPDLLQMYERLGTALAGLAGDA